VTADEAVLSELEAHGYGRASTLRHLAAGDANYAVASYCLLAEALAEAGRTSAPAPQLGAAGGAGRPAVVATVGDWGRAGGQRLAGAVTAV
jgi:hypothetical protein